LAIFYYAGHGAQLEWRNYLLPVNARVDTPVALRQQCVDLGRLLQKFEAGSGKTFVIILDACRNDPFGEQFRTEQKGLSQFDAPVGSLLAYATSPGNVAADGKGQNGLYTEHLVRELSVKDVRIEDALKRVRLNVRIASAGAQIPWETTSLEGDVYIFPNAQKNLSEAELEQIAEADLAEWARIKSSVNVADWTSYLRMFPNGRFAEIAQVRLARLLVNRENAHLSQGSPAAPVTSSGNGTNATSSSVPGTPRIELAPDRPVPQFIELTANPNSAGRFPLGRDFSTGDRYTFASYDLLSRARSEISLEVSAVDLDNDRVLLNSGTYVWDSMGNVVLEPGLNGSDTPRQFFPSELQVGKKWATGWTLNHPKLGRLTVALESRIYAFEKVRVPAGEFLAFAILCEGLDTAGRHHEYRHWVVPGLNLYVKTERMVRGTRRDGKVTLPAFARTDGLELIRASQAGLDPQCTVSGSSQMRNLVIKNACG
jgi:hypothetical protein